MKTANLEQEETEPEAVFLQWGVEAEECGMAQLVVALPLAFLLLRRPLVLLSRRLLLRLSMRRPLVVSSSCCDVLSLSPHRASWLLHHLLSSYRCAALSSSHHANWLLCCLSLRRPLIL